jgi:hypothetical protein
MDCGIEFMSIRSLGDDRDHDFFSLIGQKYCVYSALVNSTLTTSKYFLSDPDNILIVRTTLESFHDPKKLRQSKINVREMSDVVVRILGKDMILPIALRTD